MLFDQSLRAPTVENLIFFYIRLRMRREVYRRARERGVCVWLSGVTPPLWWILLSNGLSGIYPKKIKNKIPLLQRGASIPHLAVFR